MSRLFCNFEAMTQIPDDIERKLKAVIRHIEEAAAFNGVWESTFRDSTSLKSLIKVAGMSERSLRDWFKVYTGQNISKYVGRRRAEYAARIFRLFPDTRKTDVSRIIGLSDSQALYPFMRKYGVASIDDLRYYDKSNEVKALDFRIDTLSDCVLFYILDEMQYHECSSVEFDMDRWGVIEAYIERQFPDIVKIGDIGFAIDRYLEGDVNEGIFISGIICRNIQISLLTPDMFGDIGWRFIPSQKYAVFDHKGDYEKLESFYSSSLYNLELSGILVDKSKLIMERYLNSPADIPIRELITELWIPILDS